MEARAVAENARGRRRPEDCDHEWSGPLDKSPTCIHCDLPYKAPMTPTDDPVSAPDDRGAAALAERLATFMAAHYLVYQSSVAMDWVEEVAGILGERGRFLPDGQLGEVERIHGTVTEWDRLRRVAAAAREREAAEKADNAYSTLASLSRRVRADDALRAALESEG